MDRAGVRTVGLCGLALRNLPYFRFYRKGICGQYAANPVRRGCTFYDVYRSFRYQLSGVHAAVYSLHRGGATIRREFGSALKTVGVVMMQCCVAWIVALAVYTLVGIL